MKHLTSILLAALMVLTIASVSCGDKTTDPTGGGDTNTTDTNTTTATVGPKNVPSKMMVQLPKSIKQQQGGGAGAPMLRAAASAPTMYKADGEGDKSYAFAELQMTVMTVEMEVVNIGMNFVLIDAVIDGLDTSATQHPATNIVFTAGMYSNMLALLPEDYVTMVTQFMAPMVGSNMDIPAFTYSASTNTGFAYRFQMESTNADSMFGIYSMDMEWSEDKKKLKCVYGGEDEYEGITSVYDDIFTYDDAKQVSTIVYVFKDVSTPGQTNAYVSKMTLKGTNEAKDGIFITFSDEGETSFDDGQGGTMTIAMKYDAKGYADDDGGYLQTKMTMKEDGSAPDVFDFKEFFDGTGTLKKAQWSEDGGSTWNDDSTYNDTTYDETSYDDEFADFDSIEADLDGNEELLEGEFADYGVEVIELTGAIEYDFYLVASSDNISATDSTAWEHFSVVGSAFAVADGEVELDLWKDVTDGTTLYLAKSEFDGVEVVHTTNMVRITY